MKPYLSEDSCFISSLISSLTPTQDDTNCDGSADDGKGPNIVLREQLILPTRTTSAGAVGSAGADLATRAGPLGLGWARGAIGRLAASAGAVSAAARITALAVLPASAWWLERTQYRSRNKRW